MLSQNGYSSGNDSSAMRYLEAAVRNAPPARLRLMLIEKAVGLCHAISARWTANRPDLGCDEQTLHIRDIFTELLSGVGRSDLPVAQQVSDLYVFLSQHLTTAEMQRDVTMIDEIRLVLETEAETWRIVCETTANQAKPKSHPQDGVPRPAGLNLQG
jgi:flagellar protein FliS